MGNVFEVQEALAREVPVCLNGEHVCGVVSNRATG